MQVEVVAGQQLSQEFRFLVLDCLDYELVIRRHVEDGPARAWIAQLLQSLRAE